MSNLMGDLRFALRSFQRSPLHAVATVLIPRVGIGVGAGLALGVGVSVFLRGFLFGVAPADPVSTGGSTLVLLLAAMVATLVPALRAVRVNPLEALRAE
jgi:putative ABC transport system permease protein